MKTFIKTGHPREIGGGQGWKETDKSHTLSIFDNSETRTPILVVEDEDVHREEVLRLVRGREVSLDKSE